VTNRIVKTAAATLVATAAHWTSTPAAACSTDAAPGEAPWTCSVRDQGNPVAGGILLDATHVLTTAGAVAGNLSDLTVVVGAYDRADLSGTQITSVSAYDIYCGTPTSSLALLTLSTAVSYGPTVQPTQVATQPPPSGTNYQMFGWWTAPIVTEVLQRYDLLSSDVTIMAETMLLSPASCVGVVYEPGVNVMLQVGPVPAAAGLITQSNGIDFTAVNLWHPNVRAWIQNTIAGAPHSCTPCPTCGGSSGFNEALTAGIVGPLTGDDWYWQMTANTPGNFDDTAVVTVPGITPGNPADDVYPVGAPDGVWNEFDAAQRWADSINGHFTTVGCDTTSVTGNIWATVSNFGGTAYLSVSSQCGFTLLVSDPGDPTPDCDVGAFFPTCPFNPIAEAFPGSGTDCDLNGIDDFADTTFGLSPDVNLNAIPDECEGLHPEQTALGLAMRSVGNALLTQDGDAGIVISNIGESGNDGVEMTTGPVDRLDLRFDDYGDTAVGTTLRSTAVDADGNTAVAVQITRESDRMSYVPDFSSFDASEYELEVYNDGEMVGSELVAVGAGGPWQPFSIDLPDVIYAEAEVEVEILWGLIRFRGRGSICTENNAARTIVMPSGTTVVGDAVRMTAITDDLSLVRTMERFETEATNLPYVRIGEASVGYRGLSHVALGNAHLGNRVEG
jgi:hypothetical protein